MKKYYASKLIWSIAVVAMFLLHSCIIVDDNDWAYGPDGRDGKAFFALDYDWNPPYSYWDNNPSMPENAFYGEYYRSYPGIYQFEYFVNPYEYWYGTYELFTYPGQPGQPHGVAGRDGADTYLRMICNDDGFYFEGDATCNCTRNVNANGELEITVQDGDRHFKIIMKKTTINERPSVQSPKKHN